jgi:hypothetical protein
MAGVVATVRPSRRAMRALTSCAAARLNVRTRTSSAATAPDSTRCATSSTSVVVLPVPGPASTWSGPPTVATWSSTACWLGSSTTRRAAVAGSGGWMRYSTVT